MANKSKSEPLHVILEQAIRKAIDDCPEAQAAGERDYCEQTLSALGLVSSGLEMRLQELSTVCEHFVPRTKFVIGCGLPAAKCLGSTQRPIMKPIDLRPKPVMV